MRVARGLALRRAGRRVVADPLSMTCGDAETIVAVDAALDAAIAPATCINAVDRAVSIVVVLPAFSKSGSTAEAQGRPRYANEATVAYTESVANLILDAVVVAFAAAPDITTVKVAGLRRRRRLLAGRFEPLYSGQFTIDDTDVETPAEAVDAVFGAGHTVAFARDWTGRLTALDTSRYADLADLARVFTFAAARA